MSKRLPSLNALRVFVAVARSGGVSRAAEELNLTHSAVSHQIRALQSELGITLFEKSGRGLMLTEQARGYVQRIESAFKEIEEATLDVTTHNRHRLRISTIPSFAARWLLPRLGDFIATCPDVDVEVQSSQRAADVKGGEVDIGIRFDTGPHPGLYSERLMHDWLFPVCSPEFAEKYALRDASGIDGVPLMHSEREPWSSWFPAAGIVADEPEHGILFNDSALMLQAAAAGQGLCLARQSIVYDELQSGRLVRPFSTYVKSPFSYFFVCRREKLGSPPIAAFRTWIVRQIKNIPLLD
ncbi:MAG: transcriptional regulator GcvA [Propionivibrio sp.]